jgi:hypothetical protein
MYMYTGEAFTVLRFSTVSFMVYSWAANKKNVKITVESDEITCLPTG